MATEVKADNACENCIDRACRNEMWACTDTPGCADYIQCLSPCMRKNADTNLCALVCAEGKSEAAMNAAIKVLRCAPKCSKVCN